MAVAVYSVPATVAVAAPAKAGAVAAAAAAAGGLAAAAAATAASEAPDVALVQAQAHRWDPLPAQPAIGRSYRKSLSAAVVANHMQTETTTATANVNESAVSICAADRAHCLQGSHRSTRKDD